MHNSAKTRLTKGSRNLRLLVLFALIIVIVLAGLILILNKPGGSGLAPLNGLALQDIALPDGINATRFDPVASYPQMLTIAGDGANLFYISADYVKSDGTVDLTANYANGVAYNFEKKQTTTPQNAPPVGIGTLPTGAQYQDIVVSVFGPAQHHRISQGVSRFVMSSNVQKVFASAPACTFKKLWDAAIEKGVPRDTLAIIYYYSTGYEFEIMNIGVHFFFDLDCRIIEPTPSPAPTDVPTTSPG